MTETATVGTQSPSVNGRQPAQTIQQLVDQVRKEALHIQATGALTEAQRWRDCKRTYCGAAWNSYKGRTTTD